MQDICRSEIFCKISVQSVVWGDQGSSSRCLWVSLLVSHIRVIITIFYKRFCFMLSTIQICGIFVVFCNCQFNLQCEDDFSTLYVVLCQNISGTHPWDDDIWCWHAEGSFGERCFWFPESICKTLHISLLMFWIVI